MGCIPYWCKQVQWERWNVLCLTSAEEDGMAGVFPAPHAS